MARRYVFVVRDIGLIEIDISFLFASNKYCRNFPSRSFVTVHDVAMIAYALIATSAIALHLLIAAPVLFCILSGVMVLSAGIVTEAAMSMVPAVYA